MRELTLKAGGQEITVYAEESELAKLIKPERARTGYERVEAGQSYYARDTVIISPLHYEDYKADDEEKFAEGNYVNDEKLYNDRERARVLHDRLVQWQALNDGPVDWGGYEPKYRIAYDYYDKRLLVVANGSSRTMGSVYFSTDEKAEEAIEVFRDELIWYYTEYRSRLDETRTTVPHDGSDM